MRKYLLLLVIAISFNRLAAQTITVLDQVNKSPIFQVTIQEKNSEYAAITNNLGQADLSNLTKSGLLIFRHPSYKPVQISYQKLLKQSLTLYMVEQVFEMEDVVIAASKWEQNKREIPQQIAEISEKDINRAQPPTTADLLASTGQVFVQKSQLGGGSPMIRGFAANSILLVIDGVRMNNAIYRSGNLQNVIVLDPNNLHEAEVVFGPGSVLYGSDALGGVIDFHTKKAQFSEEGLSFTGAGFTRYSSAAENLTGHLSFELAEEKFSSLTSLSYATFGDLRMGSRRTSKFPDDGKRFDYVQRINNEDIVIANENVNIQTPTAYDQLNLLQKFSWKMGVNSEFTYAFHYSESSNIPRYDRLIQKNDNGDFTYGEWFYGPQKWQMHSFQMAYNYPTKWFDQARVTTAFQRANESRNDRRYQSQLLRKREETVDMLSLNIDLERSLGLNNDLFYGLELLGNQVKSEAQSTNLANNQITKESTRYPDGGSSYNSVAAYINLKNELNQQFILTSGLRYSFVKVKSKFEDKTFYDFPYSTIDLQNGAINGSLGIVFLPSSQTKINALVSSGFRSPNVDDIGKVFDSEPGVVIVPNPNLRPEFSYNFEYGFSTTLNQSIQLSFVNYYSILDNALVRRPFTFDGQSQIMYDGVLSDVYAEVNVGKAFIWGLSAGIEWPFAERLLFNAHVTYTQGEDRTNKLPLRHVSPIFGESQIQYELNKFQSSFIVKFSGGIAFEDLAPSEQNKPHLYTSEGALSWYTLNLYNSYHLNDRLSIHLNLENLLDTHYRPYSSGISAPGFNASAAIRVKF